MHAGRLFRTLMVTHAPPPPLASLVGKDTVPRPSPGPGMSDLTPAGLLAHGSSRDGAPSQVSPVAGSAGPITCASARRLQLQGQPRIRTIARPHRVPF